jgi:hypothetical protein
MPRATRSSQADFEPPLRESVTALPAGSRLEQMLSVY